MKRIAILGSTGSIGTQTLDVARKNEDLRVVAVSAGKSVEKLEEQIREFHPLLAAVWDEEAAWDLKTRIADTDTKVVSGMECLVWRDFWSLRPCRNQKFLSLRSWE